MSTSETVEYLNFTLPEFLRICWTDTRARDVWGPRFRRVINAWAQMEWASTAMDIRECSELRMSHDTYQSARQKWAAQGLVWAELEQAPNGNADAEQGNQPHRLAIRVVVGKRTCISAFERAWRGGDHDQVGRLLGYPSCCRLAFHRRCGKNQMLDPTWITAAETVGATSTGIPVELNALPMANLLWRSVGIRPVPHLPCRFDCAETLKLAALFREVGVRGGFTAEVEWLQNVLSWPVEWSALHGVAEIRTPILKISTRTDATANKLVVRWNAHDYPEEGASGVVFPYQVSARVAVKGSQRLRSGPDISPSIIQLTRTSSEPVSSSLHQPSFEG